jgi:Ca2+:H+ antiporter
MKASQTLPKWTVAAPVVAWLLFGAAKLGLGGIFAPLLAAGLLWCVVAGVHHAEVVAHRVGEPFGSLVLAVAVTVIEVSLIVALMLAGGEQTASLARDTVFAAVMLILTAILGLCLLLGGLRHREQVFTLQGATAALTTLAAIAVLTLILPNYTTTKAGPAYSPGQLVFISAVCLVLYGTFLLVQAVRHRDYFLPEGADGDEAAHAPPPSGRMAALSLGLLPICLGAVVLLAKSLAPVIEAGVAAVGAPESVVGIVIAGVVLLPEGLAAVQAARADRLQTSLNLALGSALASIGLTIPAVAAVSLVAGITLNLGIDVKSSVLFLLSLFVAVLSLSTGRTTVLQGTVLLVIFGVYLFTAIVP